MTAVVIGVIRGTHGLNGEVRVESLSDEIDHFRKLRSVQLQKGADTSNRYTVESVSTHRNSIIMKFLQVDTKDQAMRLVGAQLVVGKRYAAKRKRGEYYASDLIGCLVGRKKTVVGTVVGVVSTNASDLLEIEIETGEKVLVPFVHEYVGRIRVRRRWVELKATWEMG